MSHGEPRSIRPAPSVEEARAIARMTDPVIRNLKITQAYHDLEIALTRLLGRGNVSWCAYATWASKTAGRFIRREVLPAALLAILPAALPARIARIGDDVAEHVAEGNRLVFDEMGPLFAGMVARFSGAERGDRAELDAFLRELTPGPVERGGQDKLIEAFTHYHEAVFERDSKARAERILLANLLVGHHEQTRLQAPIAGAMSAPLLGDVRRGGAGTRADLVRRAVSPVLGRAAGAVERRWRELLTRSFMRLQLPSVTVCLGEDLPPWTDEREFPAELSKATHPRLREVLRELDRTPDTVAGSAARDWACLADRMNFVADFFRTRQQDRTLDHRPFSRLQTADIARGVVPCGAL